MQARAAVLDGPGQRLDPDGEEQGEDEDDGRVAQREEEPDAQRPLALAHELARRVVDRRDVVGVEGVAQPERVGREPDPRRERATGPEAEVVRDDEAEEQPEADDVQADDGRREAAGARPLGRGEGGADARQHASSSVEHVGQSPARGKWAKRAR